MSVSSTLPVLEERKGNSETSVTGLVGAAVSLDRTPDCIDGTFLEFLIHIQL